ncbi:MAG: leucine-rich repeat domain-containing protein, partial [Clostridiales bacterium]|nr:leucine-rich repeat domain-containing protein [Clostridiales bacterium]
QVTIGSGVTSVGESAFRDCVNLSVTWNYNPAVTAGQFSGYLKYVNIPDGVTAIESFAFGSCTALGAVTIPDSVTSRGAGAFSNCTSLTQVTIGNGVTSIGYFAFTDCTALERVFFADGSRLERIEGEAFSGCIALFDINLPADVRQGNGVFRGCTRFHYVTVVGYGWEGSETEWTALTSNLGSIVQLPTQNGAVDTYTADAPSDYPGFDVADSLCFWARPAAGYYFESWTVLSYTVDTGISVYDEGIRSRQDVYRYAINNFGSNAMVFFIKAVFTDDAEKLVPLQPLPVSLHEERSTGASVSLSALPDRMVGGTQIFAYALAAADTYILDALTFYPPGEDEWWGGNFVSSRFVPGDELSAGWFMTEDGSSFDNSTFGKCAALHLYLATRSEVVRIFEYSVRAYSYLSSDGVLITEHPAVPKKPSGVSFCFRDRGLIVERYYKNAGFVGYYDLDGRLLTNEYLYVDERFVGSDFSVVVRYNGDVYEVPAEASGSFRYRAIEDGAEWEVQYNHDNTAYAETLTVPSVYKGKPVTRIADRGFAAAAVPVLTDGRVSYLRSLPLVGRLVIPGTVREVGVEAFSTFRVDGSFYVIDAGFEVEFLSADTAVTPLTFSESGCTFVNARGLAERILAYLADRFVAEGAVAFTLKTFFEEPVAGVVTYGYYTNADPLSVYVNEALLAGADVRLFQTIVHEFRHFMQMTALGLIEGVTLNYGFSDANLFDLQENIGNYIDGRHDFYSYYNQAIEADARAFADRFFWIV